MRRAMVKGLKKLKPQEWGISALILTIIILSLGAWHTSLINRLSTAVDNNTAKLSDLAETQRLALQQSKENYSIIKKLEGHK
jgi:hypothetical protein